MLGWLFPRRENPNQRQGYSRARRKQTQRPHLGIKKPNAQVHVHLGD